MYDQAFVGPSFADEGKDYPVNLGDLTTNNADIHVRIIRRGRCWDEE